MINSNSHKMASILQDLKETSRIKRKAITFQERLDVIDRLQRGDSNISIANELGVSPSAISHIKKCKEKTLEQKQVLEKCDGDFSKKRFRGSETSTFEKAVYDWMIEANKSGVTVTGPMIQKAAREINLQQNGPSDFKASAGWFRNFKSRHEHAWSSIPREETTPSTETATSFKKKFASLMEISGITNLDHVYNCDETSLFWKLLPKKPGTSNDKKQAVPGLHDVKSRITVLNCINASGTHKLPLFLIGKVEKPQETREYPVFYSQQSNAWMNWDLMKEWFNDCFIPSIKRQYEYENDKDLKIVLLLDNAPCHPISEFLQENCGFITVMVLPQKTAPLLQPMNLGISEKFKKCYRHALLTYLLIENLSQNFTEAYENLKLTDCFRFCVQAWNEITVNDIRSCWKALIPLKNDDEAAHTIPDVTKSRKIHTILSNLPDYSEITMDQTDKWLDSDKNEPCWKPVARTKQRDSKNSENEAHDDENPVITTKNVYDAMNLIIEWSAARNDEFSGLAADLRKWHPLVSRELVKELIAD